MKKKIKKLKKKISKRVRTPKIKNPDRSDQENTEDEQDKLDAFFAHIHYAKRSEQEMKYQNRSVIEICNILEKNLNDEMFYDTVVEHIQEINGLFMNLNQKLGI